MTSHVTREFRKAFERLPADVKKQAVRAYRLWQKDLHHTSLQFKRVSQRQPVYSVRIGIGYRALGFMEGDVIYWFWVGSHSDYDNLLTRL